jgi:hypothetical protein
VHDYDHFLFLRATVTQRVPKKEGYVKDNESLILPEMFPKTP